MNAKEFGYKLHETRAKKGFSLRQLQRQSGINNAYISLIEHGKRIPKTSTLRKLAHGLRVPASKLFRMAGIEPEQSSNSSPSETADLADPNKAWTFEGKRVSSETMKFVRRMIKGGK